MNCPACGHGEMRHETWDKLISYQGKSLTVHAVSGERCAECGEALYDEESYDRVAAAGDGLIRAFRMANPPEVRVIREKLGLTQVEAGKVFGGGVNAFSRYERGETKPGTQMRKLLKIAEKHPELIKELAEIA
jgi:HTH-type transcriptional regulator/antitoxin MqsA